MRNVAFEFNNMETVLVMHVNFLYLILVDRGFELDCNSKPLHENCQKLALLRRTVSGRLVFVF
jgi:hypothetical protein